MERKWKVCCWIVLIHGNWAEKRVKISWNCRAMKILCNMERKWKVCCWIVLIHGNWAGKRENNWWNCRAIKIILCNLERKRKVCCWIVPIYENWAEKGEKIGEIAGLWKFFVTWRWNGNSAQLDIADSRELSWKRGNNSWNRRAIKILCNLARKRIVCSCP